VRLLKNVSVVISTYSESRASFLLDTIPSLNGQSIKPCEIILVLDPSPSIVEFYKSQLPNDVKIVVSDRFGLSNARNAGIKNAKGEIIAFIDDDAVADKKWLENLVRNYADPNVVGVGGLIKPLWEDCCGPRWFPAELNWILGCSYKGLPTHRAVVRNPIGCNMSFRKEIFEKVGYFRSDIGRFGKKLLAGEEPELSMRILEKVSNSKIIYDPSAVVYHRINRSRVNLKYLWTRCFFEGISKALIINPQKKASLCLSAENQYLRYLLNTAIPSRLRSLYKFDSVCQLLILLFSIMAVFVGFVFGKLGAAGK
jgi:glycosyltransferase involved in cell wall biosynthesis